MKWVHDALRGIVIRSVIGIALLMTGPVHMALAQQPSQSFASINLPSNAHVSALGGVNVSLADQNINFFQSNPSLNSDTLNGWASINHLFYFANIGLSTFSYQHQFERLGAFAFGFQHLSLGNIDGYDAAGNATQSYSSGESTLFIGKSHQIHNFRLGINAKGVFSNLAGFRASALLFDLGGSFIHPSRALSIGMVIKNIGFVTNSYSSASSSDVPFDVQVGVSYKPEHMPLRFSATAYNLLNFNNASLDTLINRDQPSTLDEVMRHFVFGAEILLHRNISLLIGYNFLKHSELKLEQAGGGAGFSIGAKANVRDFSFGFSRAGYVAGGAWQLSLDVNTNRFLKKRRI